jgi:hypothetical protein
LRRFAYALTAEVPGDRFLEYAIVLEALFGEGSRHGVGAKVADRCASLLGRDSAERTQVQELVRAIFVLRNDVVHRGLHERLQESQVVPHVARLFARRTSDNDLELLLREARHVTARALCHVVSGSPNK